MTALTNFTFESVYSVTFETYHGASTIIRKIFDWHAWTMSIAFVDYLPINQLICLSFTSFFRGTSTLVIGSSSVDLFRGYVARFVDIYDSPLRLLKDI